MTLIFMMMDIDAWQTMLSAVSADGKEEYPKGYFGYCEKNIVAVTSLNINFIKSKSNLMY